MLMLLLSYKNKNTLTCLAIGFSLKIIKEAFMKLKLIIGFVFITLIVKGQEKPSASSSGSFIEPHLRYLFAAGQVNVQGSGQPFMNSIYSGSGANQAIAKDHDGNYLGFGAVFGKYLSPDAQVGLGVDLDFYLNIGQSTRNTLPFYADIKYQLHDPGDKNSIFFYGDAGYAPKIGNDFHAGFKGAAGIGYAIKSKKTGNSYNISLGYNYQVLRNLKQYVFTTNANGNVNTLTSINLQNVIVNSVPLQFGITF